MAGRKSTAAPGKAGFKWSKEFDSTDVVCGWLHEVLESLVPAGSTAQVSHAQLTAKLSAFLEGRGTERA